MASTTAVGEAEVLTSIIAAIPAQPATCYYKHIHAIADVFLKKNSVTRKEDNGHYNVLSIDTTKSDMVPQTPSVPLDQRFS